VCYIDKLVWFCGQPGNMWFFINKALIIRPNTTGHLSMGL